jgi:hypothetical protein
MTLDELKERFSTEAKQSWEKFQDSSLYNQMRDRYENMSPLMQKLTLAGVGAALALFLLSFPYSAYNQSGEYVAEFEDKRAVIRELLKVSREASDVPNIPVPPPMESLKNMADTQVKNANLIPEQIKSIEVAPADSKLIPQSLSMGSLVVTLSKLNLRQVVDLGYQLQSINPSVKVQDLSMTANREDSRYFDVVYKLVALSVPSLSAGVPDEPIRPPSRIHKGSRGK